MHVSAFPSCMTRPFRYAMLCFSIRGYETILIYHCFSRKNSSLPLSSNLCIRILIHAKTSSKESLEDHSGTPFSGWGAGRVMWHGTFSKLCIWTWVVLSKNNGKRRMLMIYIPFSTHVASKWSTQKVCPPVGVWHLARQEPVFLRSAGHNQVLWSVLFLYGLVVKAPSVFKVSTIWNVPVIASRHLTAKVLDKDTFSVCIISMDQRCTLWSNTKDWFLLINTERKGHSLDWLAQKQGHDRLKMGSEWRLFNKKSSFQHAVIFFIASFPLFLFFPLFFRHETQSSFSSLLFTFTVISPTLFVWPLALFSISLL